MRFRWWSGCSAGPSRSPFHAAAYEPKETFAVSGEGGAVRVVRPHQRADAARGLDQTVRPQESPGDRNRLEVLQSRQRTGAHVFDQAWRRVGAQLGLNLIRDSP